jgi:glycosyltransferase involved in cell wall biosynthesis
MKVLTGSDTHHPGIPVVEALARKDSARAEGVRRPVRPASCGTDPGRFHPDVDPAPFRAAHDLRDRPTIIFVGRLDAEEHVDQLIRALPLVRESVDAQLVVVGTGHQHQALVALATDLGVIEHVTFAGSVPDDDLPGAYAAADVCVPGTAELSVVTREAMATGRPVIGADARAITRILTEPATSARMELEGLRLVAEHEAGATLDAFEEVCTELVGGIDATAPVADQLPVGAAA